MELKKMSGIYGPLMECVQVSGSIRKLHTMLRFWKGIVLQFYR